MHLLPDIGYVATFVAGVAVASLVHYVNGMKREIENLRQKLREAKGF